MRDCFLSVNSPVSAAHRNTHNNNNKNQERKKKKNQTKPNKQQEHLAVIYDGLTRLLSNPLESLQGYLPGATKAIQCYQEILVLLWKLLDENQVRPCRVLLRAVPPSCCVLRIVSASVSCTLSCHPSCPCSDSQVFDSICSSLPPQYFFNFVQQQQQPLKLLTPLLFHMYECRNDPCRPRAG